jgi:hypothetical protein
MGVSMLEKTVLALSLTGGCQWSFGRVLFVTSWGDGKWLLSTDGLSCLRRS